VKTSLETMTLEDDIARMVRRQFKPSPLRWAAVALTVVPLAVAFVSEGAGMVVRHWGAVPCIVTGEANPVACVIRNNVLREFEECRARGDGCGDTWSIGGNG